MKLNLPATPQVTLCEEQIKMLAHRASILAAEAERLSGAPTYTICDVRARLKEKYAKT